MPLPVLDRAPRQITETRGVAPDSLQLPPLWRGGYRADDADRAASGVHELQTAARAWARSAVAWRQRGRGAAAPDARNLAGIAVLGNAQVAAGPLAGARAAARQTEPGGRVDCSGRRDLVRRHGNRRPLCRPA